MSFPHIHAALNLIYYLIMISNHNFDVIRLMKRSQNIALSMDGFST